MEPPTRFFLGLNLLNFVLRSWWRKLTHIVRENAVGIVAQQVGSNNGGRGGGGGGGAQVGKPCGCYMLRVCVRVRLVCVCVCVFNRVCSGAGSSGAPPGPPGSVSTLLLDGQGAAGCYGRETGRPGWGGGRGRGEAKGGGSVG